MPSLGIGINGLGLMLNLDDKEILELAVNAYGAFVSVPDDCLTVDVSVSRQAGDEKCRDLSVSCESNVVRAVRTDFDGWIDVNKKSASVRIYPTAYQDVSLDAFLRLVVSVWALKNYSLLMHGASIVSGGKGFLFVGKSGAGKSTISGLAMKSGLRVLSDEISLVRKTEGGWIVGGTPFHGENSDAKDASSAPLSAIAVLKKSPEMRVGYARKNTERRQLMRQVLNFGAPPSEIIELFRLVNCLIEDVGLKTLAFRPEEGVWELLNDLQR